MADSASATVALETDSHETLQPSQEGENQPKDQNAPEIIKTESNEKTKPGKEVVKEPNLPPNHPSTSCNSATTEGCRTKAKISTLTTQDEKRLNGVKHMSSDPNHNVFDHSLSTGPEYTVTSDNQIWLECNQYNNTFRAYGGNVRSFQPHSSKLNNQLGSPNHLFGQRQRSPQGPPGRRGGLRNANYDRKTEHVVHLHVNPGEAIQFEMLGQMQLISGPATVRMVSSNPTPPMPMPVQVPPGHMVQQIVDEHGTLRHIILSPQPPVSVTAGNPYNGNTSGNVTSPISGSAPFYLYPHPSFSVHAQFPPHMQPGLGAQGLHGSIDPMQLHQTNGHAANSGLADSSSSHLNAFKDERTQRQFFKLKKRLEARHKDGNSSSVSHGTAERSPERLNNVNNASESKMSESERNSTNSVPETVLSFAEMAMLSNTEEAQLLKALSSIEAPCISDITATSALLKWKPVSLNLESKNDFQESELQYALLISDKVKDDKHKTVYSGKDLEHVVNDLKPATSYFAWVQADLNGITGTPSENAAFKTLCCEPDIPQPPKLVSRTKTTITLKWNAVADNGAKILSYILEYDEGTGSDEFVECFSGLQKQYKAVKLKISTLYRFRLAAVNEIGKSDYSEISCFSTSGSTPSQPLPPVLKEAFINKLSLEWESRPNDDSYTLQMDDETTLHGFLNAYNGKDTFYACSNLKRNSNFKFRLCAINDEGSSPWSQTVTYTTLPDKPGKPGKPCLKGRAHSNFVKVAWDPPKDDGGSEITGYSLHMDCGNGFCVVYNGSEIEFVCENLEPGKSYDFKVQCTNAGGTSVFSDVGTVTTLPVAPGKCQPPKLQGKPKASSLHLKWTNPEYDGGSEILEHEVEVLNPDDSSRIAYKGHGTDCVVAGLLPGRMYRFRVRAYNKAGVGQWSEIFETLSGAGTPDMPKNVQTVPRSPHCIYVSWSEPENNGAAITEYRLESKHGEKEYELMYSGASCYAEVKSLIPATLYCFQVQAINSAGAGPFCECVSCQTPPSSPGPVSTASIKSAIGPSSISLSWKEPNNHGSSILSYIVEIGDAMHTTDGETPEICIEGLVPETTYKLRVQAINSVGPGPFSSSIKIVTRGLPPLPPILECCGYSYNSLRLKWGDGKNLDMKTYTLELENKQTNKFMPVYQGTSSSYKVSKLQELTTYNFRIYASNEEGDGPYSDVYTFSTQRALPPALKAPKVSSISETSCVVEWMAAKPIGEDMLSYKLQLGTKESDFHVFYTGIQTCYTMHNLKPGSEFSVRVAAVRHCTDGELPGPFSPCTVFCTNSVSVTEAAPPRIFSIACCLKNREPLTDQQWAMIILCGFAFFAICVAMIIQQVLSFTTS